MSNLRPVFIKYPFLLRPAAALALVIFPFVVTYNLWREDWKSIKSEASYCWKTLIHGEQK